MRVVLGSRVRIRTAACRPRGRGGSFPPPEVPGVTTVVIPADAGGSSGQIIVPDLSTLSSLRMRGWFFVRHTAFGVLEVVPAGGSSS